MRWFLSTNAARPIQAGGRSFSFEPIAIRGGTWLGVLAADDESAASILSARPEEVDEISQEKYDDLKKKLTDFAPPSTPQPPPAASPPGEEARVAERAGSLTPLATSDPALPAIPGVTLQTTALEPPIDPLLAEPAAKRRGVKPF